MTESKYLTSRLATSSDEMESFRCTFINPLNHAVLVFHSGECRAFMMRTRRFVGFSVAAMTSCSYGRSGNKSRCTNEFIRINNRFRLPHRNIRKLYNSNWLVSPDALGWCHSYYIKVFARVLRVDYLAHCDVKPLSLWWQWNNKKDAVKSNRDSYILGCCRAKGFGGIVFNPSSCYIKL